MSDPTASPYPLTPPPHVPQVNFMGAIWGGVAISFVFLVVRLYSRLKPPRQFFWDDGLVIFSWFLALLTAILWQVVSGYMYTFMYVISGRLWPPPADFLLNTERYYTGQLIVLIFFYTGLWSVKLSFLIFFRRLGQNIDKQKYLWWPVLFFTLATYFVCIGDIPYKCLVGSLDEIVVKCSPGENIKFTLDTLKVNCSLDVLSDFLIMIIPITLIWNVRIRWEKKLALMGIFSLVLVTMAISIVRVVVNSGLTTSSIVQVTDTNGLTKQPDTSWLYLWSSIEQCVAIIIAGLSAFPRLFSGSNNNSKPQFTPSDTYKDRMRRRQRPQSQVELHAVTTISDEERLYYASTASLPSQRLELSQIEAQK